MQNIRVICVGKLRDRFFSEAANEYIKRMSAYCNIEIIEIPEHRLPDSPSASEISKALAKECALIEDKIPSGAACAALCIEGESIDSPGLSALLTKYAVSGVSKLCFIVGSSYGLHTSIKSKSDIMLSMSKMTFPHTLARVILLEQLYRALSIAGGGKYHK